MQVEATVRTGEPRANPEMCREYIAHTDSLCGRMWRSLFKIDLLMFQKRCKTGRVLGFRLAFVPTCCL